MLQAQGTTADAVLCFAVHYDCRQPSQSCLGTGALSQLSCVSRHCLAALRQQIAPSLFAQCPQFYDQARTAEHFLALMRFNQLCRQDSALWSHSFVQGLKRFYLDARLPFVACRLLLDALHSLEHQKSAHCSEHCGLCKAAPLVVQLDQTNLAGEALSRTLAHRPLVTLERAAWYHETYLREVTQLVAQMALALQAAGAGYTAREQLCSALNDMCQDRITQRLDEWLRCLMVDDQDLYTLLLCSSELTMHDALQRIADESIRRMSRQDIDDRVAHFFAVHVRTEEDCLQRVHTFRRAVLASVRRFQGSGWGPVWLNALFRVHALLHMCAHDERYDNAALARIVEHLLSWHQDNPYTAGPNDTHIEEARAVKQFMALLERRDAQDALAKIFAPLPAKDEAPLARMAQQQARNTESVMQKMLMDEVLQQSCDPFDIFLHQGVPLGADGTYGDGVALYLDMVVPVVQSLELPQLGELLQNCNANFNARHWARCIPFELRNALAQRYGVCVCVLPVTLESFHLVIEVSLLCMAPLQALDAFGTAVAAWLEQCAALFVREAQRAMYNTEWRCSCGQEYANCVPRALQLYSAVSRDRPLYIQLGSLELDYATTLMRQEYAMYGDMRNGGGSDDDALEDYDGIDIYSSGNDDDNYSDGNVDDDDDL